MSLSQTLSGMTGAESLRLKPMKQPGSVVPKTFNLNPGSKKTGGSGGGAKKATPLNPYDAFSVANPYDPKTIDQTALSGYNEDVGHARDISQMGYLTPAQIDAQAQNRATQQTALGSSLAAALAGIQQSYVGQGNAAASGLGAQNAADAAGGARVMAASGAAPVAPPNVSALLGSQTASGANIYGADQAAALSSGNLGAQAALASGETLKQTTQADQAKGLAGLLANIASTSSRRTSMLGENAKAQAANKATDLSIWTGIENRRLTAAAQGDKVAEAKAALEERNLEAGMSSADRLAIASGAQATSSSNNAATNATSTANSKRAQEAKVKAAKIAAAAKTGAAAARARGGLTASQRATLGRDVGKIIGTQGGQKVSSNEVTGYTVVLTPKAGSRAELTNPKGYKLPVSAADGAKVKVGGAYGPSGQYGDYVVGAVQPKTTKGTTVKNAPSAWTNWKRALGRVQTVAGLNRTDATVYLAQMGYPAPKSPGK